MVDQSTSTFITVEVAFALADKQEIESLRLPEGCTAEEAVKVSELPSRFSEIDLANLSLGIFSKAVKLNQILREGDRVEIYRPLIADPKEIRRQRAEAAKQAKLEKDG